MAKGGLQVLGTKAAAGVRAAQQLTGHAGDRSGLNSTFSARLGSQAPVAAPEKILTLQPSSRGAHMKACCTPGCTPLVVVTSHRQDMNAFWVFPGG